jgi:adenylate kinase
MMKLVLLGPSGAGKGTQAKQLSKRFNITHISTGDILRGHIARKTEIGRQIADIMDKGKLVSDEIVIELVKERIAEPDCVNGFILDGFPRNLHQARILNNITDIDRVVYINLDDDIIIKRMSGRFSCPDCGAVFHAVYYPPKNKGLCAACDAILIQREDDKESTVVNRLRIYHDMTVPIIDFFKAYDLVSEVNGLGEADEITAHIVKLLLDMGRNDLKHGYPNKECRTA